ncbi:MAG: hypothetical protein NTY05_09350, partial [Rhodocyclales bacterium]|nr:hypothetical protein [Rhodocyclales bacterium]
MPYFLVLGPGSLAPHRFQRRLELATADIEVIDRPRVAIHRVAQADHHRIDAHFLRDHVEQALEGKARVGHAVAAEGATGRLVGVDPVAQIAVVRDMVKRRHHAAGVVGGNDAERTVSTAVEMDGALEGSDSPVLLHPQLEFHVLLVASAVMEEDLLAAVYHPHRAAGLAGKDGRAEVEWRGLRLATESAADRRPQHADLAQRHIQDMGQHVVDVVRDLVRRIHQQRAVLLPVGDRGVWLQRRLVGVVADERFLADVVGLGESLL